jgi:hypothetical protein
VEAGAEEEEGDREEEGEEEEEGQEERIYSVEQEFDFKSFVARKVEHNSPSYYIEEYSQCINFNVLKAMLARSLPMTHIWVFAIGRKSVPDSPFVVPVTLLSPYPH